jgi:hypothetical protein
MRKKIRPTPTRTKLPLAKETVRTLDDRELNDVQTGAAARQACPTTMSTSTFVPPDV